MSVHREPSHAVSCQLLDYTKDRVHCFHFWITQLEHNFPLVLGSIIVAGWNIRYLSKVMHFRCKRLFSLQNNSVKISALLGSCLIIVVLNWVLSGRHFPFVLWTKPALTIQFSLYKGLNFKYNIMICFTAVKVPFFWKDSRWTSLSTDRMRSYHCTSRLNCWYPPGSNSGFRNAKATCWMNSFLFCALCSRGR